MEEQVYDEIEIEDLEFDPEQGLFSYPCPCGDRFQITLEEIKKGEVIATCPSCSLTIKIIYDEDSYKEYEAYMNEVTCCWFLIFFNCDNIRRISINPIKDDWFKVYNYL